MNYTPKPGQIQNLTHNEGNNKQRTAVDLSQAATLKKTTNWFSRPIIVSCRSKVLLNALSLRSLFCLFLSGRFTQVLLYKEPHLNHRLRTDISRSHRGLGRGGGGGVGGGA